MEREGKRFYKLKADKLVLADNKAYYQLFSNLSVLAIGVTGLAYFWKDCSINSCVQYQIPLLSRNERITAVEFVNDENVVIGSSSGEIYLLEIENYNLTTYSFYTHTSITSYIMGFLSQTRLDPLSTIEKQCSNDAIVSIRAMESKLYILTSSCIQVWCMGQNNNEIKVKFLLR